MSPSLRDHILNSLSALPNAHKLHLVTLSSTPKRNTSLFPHTPSPPRCFQIDYLMVLGTNTSPSSLRSDVSSQERNDQVEEDTRTGQSDTASGQMVLTSAIFATLYILPHNFDSILYISKVDSSSYTASSSSISPSIPTPTPTATSKSANLPLTRTLITAFISYFLLYPSRPAPSIRVQLFARSQGQYLFPNSAAGKKGLGGGRLCGWWKGVYEDVVRAVVATPGGTTKSEGEGTIRQGAESTPLVQPPQVQRVPTDNIHLSYLLPSYSALEAKGMMGLPRIPLPQGIEWAYEPPFALPMPGIGSSSAEKSGRISLADLIPSLEDDPKTRFLDELATDTETRTRGGTSQISTNGVLVPGKSGSEAEITDGNDVESGPTPSQTPSQGKHCPASLETAQPELSVTPSTPTAFTSTPNHLQPCTTPTDPISPPNQASSSNTKKPSTRHTPKALTVAEDEKYRRQAHSTLSQTSPEEFWERMGYRGECALDVTGFFTLRVSPHPIDVESQAIAESHTPSSYPGTSPRRGQLPPTIVHRIHESLLNTDFATFPLALEGSKDWMESMRRIVVGEIGEEGLGMCVGEVEAKVGKELEVVGEKRERVGEKVTVLQPRKKKKV